MVFLDSFNTIINDATVKKETRRLLDLGKNDTLFSNYFGVNYNASDLVSVKLYFCYLKELPPDEVLREFISDQDFMQLLKANWKPSHTLKHHHDGITLSLKCYLKNGEVRINKYAYFRTEKFLFGMPEKIQLAGADLNNEPGFCIEQHENSKELKKYYYISSAENKASLIKMFNCDQVIRMDDISLIEYTESSEETKINIALNTPGAVQNYLISDNNQNIIDLSRFFYTNHQLLYFSPGLRLNSSTRALYYLPEYRYRELRSVNTIDSLFKN